MKCLLLALTGMGNAVLEACLTICQAHDILVVTRAEAGPYPYHPCDNLADVCRYRRVRCLPGADLREPQTQNTLQAFAPDIAISATFHQIVPQAVLSLPPLGIYNIHPSLLPAYKGPMPTNWAIIHGEEQSGVTVHEMTPGLDEGRIALQQAVDIGADNDGELRRRMAGVAGELAGRLLGLAETGGITLMEQEGAGSRHPRLLSPEGIRLLLSGGFDPENVRRGVMPWPGLKTLTEYTQALSLDSPPANGNKPCQNTRIGSTIPSASELVKNNLRGTAAPPVPTGIAMTLKSEISRADRTEEASGFPAVVLLDNCNACNLRCSMCDHPNMTKHRKVQIMDMGLYRKIIDEIARENPSARVWQIFFGDPFMCRDMPERIRYAKDKGLTDVVLNTNGMLMKPEKARAVIEAGLDSMYVGIDAADAATYEKIRVGGKYETAVANVLAYRDILREIGRPDQKLFVQFVVSDINEDQVEAFKAFWTSEGVNVKIRPKVSWAGLVSADNLLENEQVGRRPCYWLMRTINICADGRVALCSVDVHCRVPCGDANTKSIKELWASQLQKYRCMHNEGRFAELPPMCRDCRDWQSGYADFVTV